MYLIHFGVFLRLLFLGFVFGRESEKQHFKELRKRELRWKRVPALTGRSLVSDSPIKEARLVTGSVVVSVDYFKRFLTSIRVIFGGEAKSYSPLLERGRREALCRMKESCPEAQLFLNCRLQTATLFNGQGKSTGSVEVIAYATAVVYARTEPIVRLGK